MENDRTMKWFNRIAQGFSPGKTDRGDRPERAADLGSNIGIRLFGVKKRVFVCPVSQHATGNGVDQDRLLRTSVALAGRGVVGRLPGLKPWAILLDHFMFKNLQRRED
jgi:hypothetical protein